MTNEPETTEEKKEEAPAELSSTPAEPAERPNDGGAKSADDED